MTQTNYTTKILRVADYERLSSDEQARHGLSIGAQVSALGRWVTDHHHIMVGHYTDAGISGGNPIEKRPAMWRLLQDIQSGLVDLVIFTKLDRWFRSLKNYYKAQEILDGSHCAWQAIDEDYETLTSTGRFKVNIMLSVAQQERERTSERLKSVFDYKRAQGKFLTGGRTVPYGYKLQDGHLIIDEATAPVVRDLFDRVLSGMSYKGVFAAIRAEHPDFRHSYTAMRALTLRPVYAGIMNGIPDSCPAYITQDQRNQLLTITGTRSPRRTDQVFLFSGLIRCPECGGRLTTCRAGDYVYYYCRRAKRDRKCSCRISLREERIEHALTGLLFTPGEIVVDSVKATQSAGKHVQTAPEIERKMKRLAETYTDGLIDRETYKAKLATLTEQLEAIRNAPSRPSEPISDKVKEFLQGDLQTVYERLSRQERRAFWMQMLHTVTMDQDYVVTDLP